MILSDKTTKILQNFATINSGMLFRTGNVIRTISPQKTIMAKATVDETFDHDFAIFNLNRFLGVLSLFQNPEIVVGDKSTTIMADKQKLVYVHADPTTFMTPPEKDVTFPISEVTFKLKSSDLDKVKKAGNVMQLPEIAVTGDGSTMTIRAVDMKNPTADGFSIDVGTTDLNFNAVFKAEQLVMLPNDYDVSISSKGISKFEAANLTYWVAVEASSTF
jgi:hypothetical protein